MYDPTDRAVEVSAYSEELDHCDRLTEHTDSKMQKLCFYFHLIRLWNLAPHRKALGKDAEEIFSLSETTRGDDEEICEKLHNLYSWPSRGLDGRVV